MKKILLVLLLTGTALSCSEEDEDCNCGTVLSDNVEDYSVVIRSNCSGNSETFILQPGDWINALVGSEYCITNSTDW